MKEMIKDYLISIGINKKWSSFDFFIEDIINGEISKWEIFFNDEGELNHITSIIRDYKLNKILN